MNNGDKDSSDNKIKSDELNRVNGQDLQDQSISNNIELHDQSIHNNIEDGILHMNSNKKGDEKNSNTDLNDYIND